jgi:hypothetical protein
MAKNVGSITVNFSFYETSQMKLVLKRTKRLCGRNRQRRVERWL